MTTRTQRVETIAHPHVVSSTKEQPSCHKETVTFLIIYVRNKHMMNIFSNRSHKTHIISAIMHGITITFSSMALPSLAQSDFRLHKDDVIFPLVRDINWMNSTYLEKQRRRVDNLARSDLGRQLHGNMSDIATLQRIVDRELIANDNKEMLQALGVALGDVYVAENKNLHWMVYEDAQGPSHAICLKDTKHCIFAITMLSRRMAVGVKPNVQEIYTKGLNLIKPFFEKLPFSD